ncbi:MAG: beta-N-acetylhexosaminidase [bacterium]
MDTSNFAGEPAIIPAPVRLERRDGSCTLTSSSRILAADDLGRVANYLAEITGLQRAAAGADSGAAPATSIHLTRTDQSPGAEGYRLTATPQRIDITAGTDHGAFNGVQTLRQLAGERLLDAGSLPVAIPAVTVVDTPRFGWRGLLLDCCRHFVTKDFVKRTIDLLALHKLNRLHWHLTEDQGWRLASDRYPRLIGVGAWRPSADGERYGGFYSQQDIREVVAYAASRHVTVVPEIEMPGHATAALAAYPEFSCRGEALAVKTEWGIFDEVFCAGNEATFEFLEQILGEVMALFPGEYIHIGGDECPRKRWRDCSRCQARIRDEGLADEDALQGYFTGRIARFLARHGRRAMGWDEILDGGLPAGAAVQSWRGLEGAVAAARAGHDAIVSPTSHAYFDYDVSVTDLRKVYGFDPVPPGLTADQRRHILGGEACLWTERAPQETIDGKLFPRLLAMAECLWSAPGGKDFEDFQQRVQRHNQRLSTLGVKSG